MSCRCLRARKSKAYGRTKKAWHWCNYCDANIVPQDPNKGSERAKAKREIFRERKRIGK